MNPDPYRGIWGGKHCRDSPIQTTRSCDCKPDHCQASDRYLEQLDDVLNYEVNKKKVAGIFIESIQVIHLFSSKSDHYKSRNIASGLWWCCPIP